MGTAKLVVIGLLAAALAVGAACASHPSPPRPAPEGAPAARPSELRGLLRDCRLESISRPPDAPVEAYRCGDLRVVADKIDANTAAEADELLAILGRQRKNLGWRTETIDGTMAGGHLEAIYSEVGPADRPLYAELAGTPKASLGFARLTCWANGRAAVGELCWDLLNAVSERKQELPVRDTRAKWNLDIAARPVSLTEDCYWKGPQNIFCRQGQLSWDFTSELPRAMAFAEWNLKRASTRVEKLGGSGNVTGSGPCRVLGQATRCVRARMELTLPDRVQIVDAIYGAVPVGVHALMLICSVDRATVPEGIGPLCGQVIEIE